jgi:hypothetical protein
MFRSLVALLVTATVAPAVVAQVVSTQVEPSSKVQFPVEITVVGGTDTHVLTGVAVRTKTFLKVKVYAFGIYVDGGAARTTLSAFADQTERDLERNDDFYDRILDMDFGMSLRLVMTRDVDGETMADAFEGALRPRVQLAAAEMNMPGGEAALETFRGYFSVEEMTKEAELLFSCTPEGTLSSLVKGELAADIQSPALCWALFDVYLGEDPISGDGKKRVIRNFPGILAPGN